MGWAELLGVLVDAVGGPVWWGSPERVRILVWWLVVALLACMVVGMINGLFTAVVGINSFITTLDMLLGLEGLTLIISNAEPVSTPGTSNATGQSTFPSIFGGGTYSELIWALVIVGVLQVVLTFTRWGIYSVAVGGNRRGAAFAWTFPPTSSMTAPC